ncbi:Sigma intracellular receptor 2 protein [Dioscorea alata]|uniref:Sigma intracellular receptor 2 protein n=1 Tax=Dioscorea alata TaxID=55571 RepID=A0ACB7VN72_DIOAL|nr:Sigma intracellular receptor 2 protein [Dioscorea alata]
MAVVSGLVGFVVVVFSLVMVVLVPLFEAQACFPLLYPQLLVDLNHYYSEQYDDYLTIKRPGFFVGLAWVDLLFLWPLSIANVYGILARKPWVNTTTLMAGVSSLTAMGAVMGEVLNNYTEIEALLILLERYVPNIGFSFSAILYSFLPSISSWWGVQL